MSSQRRSTARGRNVGARFVEQIKILDTGCWEWQGARLAKGYGVLWVDGQNVGAHRLSYTLFVGPIPDGMHVCHRCDVPSCCNPEHLFVDTTQVNTADRHAKGRDSRGAKHWNSRLEPDDVRAIRVAVENGESQTAVAARYGVSRSNVSAIMRGRAWAHIH